MDGWATMTKYLSPTIANWGFADQRVGVVEGLDCECWGRRSQVIVWGISLSLSNNAGELWALAKALLWLKHESNDSSKVSVTFVYVSEVAKIDNSNLSTLSKPFFM